MGLETASFVNGLNALNPVGATDPKSQGDDHLRLIKSCLVASFPNINAAVTATPAQLNGLITPTVPANKVKGTGAANAGVATTVLHSDVQILIDLTDAYAWTGLHKFADGTVAIPGIAFTSDTNTGIYRAAADDMRLAAGGVDGIIVQSAALFSQLVHNFSNGALASLSIRFGNDTDTGLYLAGANEIGIVSGGVLAMDITNARVLFPDGVVGTPGITFISDPDTGLYHITANQMGLAAGGALIANVYSGGVNFTNTVGNQILFPDGTAALPGIGFTADGNTGFYRSGGDAFLAAIGGSDCVRFGANGIFTTGAQVNSGGALLDIGFRHIPQNAQPANYTIVAEDSGKHIYHASGAGAGDVYTIPANATVAFPIGTVITFINSDSNSISIAITTDTMTLAGTTSTGSRTLGQNGIATAVKVTATSWIISGTALS